MARYALVIGVSQYQKPLGNLEKTTSDAEAVAQILEQRGDFQKVIRLPARFNPDKSVYEMVPRAVTGAELGQAIKDFFLERADKSEALIYFTGHGITVADHLGQQKGYLAPSDCVIETQGKDIVEQRHGLALDSLNDLIRASNLSSLVLLLDCCHGGYFLERNLVEQTLTAFSSQKDYYLITACRGFERAWAITTEQHDVFTGALLRGLAPDNAGRDGHISGDRLFDYISSELKDSRQEPIRMGWGRSIQLITYPVQQLPTLETAPLFKAENPYLGLNAFALEQADYFCGREQIVRVLIDHLRKSRFLAVIGPSGCGKSSLVKAGLFPLFKRNGLPGSSQWEIEAFTPGNYPIDRLREILVRQQQRSEPFVLFIDQFEELFTLCSDDQDRRDFIRLMSQEATNSERPTKVIIAIRGDFLDRCAAYPEAASLINQTQPNLVTPLTLLELNEAVEKPASLHGVNFESGLVSQIANDVIDRPGALPLLQYALTELWRVCIEEVESPRPCLTWDGYREIGGVKGALEKRADLLYLSFPPEDQAFARRLLLELVQIGEGQEFTRRRATWEDLRAIADSPEQLDRVTRRLSDQQQRLIITSDKTVEVAHEALFSEWKLLHDWIEESREDIQLNRRLEAACQDWQDIYQKSEDALLTGAPLAAIEAWAQKSQPKLPQQEAEFLRKSIEKRDREFQTQLEQERRLREEAEARAIAELEKKLEAEARAEAEAASARESGARIEAEKQRNRITISAVSLAFILLSAIGIVKIQALTREARIIREAEIKALIDSAKISSDSNKQLESLMFSIKALKKLDEDRTKEVPIVVQRIISQVLEYNRFEGHQQEVLDAGFSSLNSAVASASFDGTVGLWKDRHEFLQPIKRDLKSVWSVDISPDGHTIASSGSGESVMLWNIDGTFKTELKVVNEPFNSSFTKVRFSPDGKKLAASSWDGTIKIWDLTNNVYLTSLKGHRDAVYSISFSKNSQRLASASRDRTIKVWDLSKNSIIATLKGHSDTVYGIAYCASDQKIYSASKDGTVGIWNAKNYQSAPHFLENSDEVNDVNCSPDGQKIAVAGKGNAIKVWNVKDAKLLQEFKGHDDAVNSVRFSLDSMKIVSASDDKTVRIWSLIPISQASTVRSTLISSCRWIEDYLDMHSSNSSQDIIKICSSY